MLRSGRLWTYCCYSVPKDLPRTGALAYFDITDRDEEKKFLKIDACSSESSVSLASKLAAYCRVIKLFFDLIGAANLIS